MTGAEYAGEYVDDFRLVSKMYLAEGFYWDFVVSIPFTWVEYIW